MSLFTARKPRGFQHNYIYYDPRKEKLKAIEENAKRSLGLLPPKEFTPEDIRGKFVSATKHLRSRKEKEAAGKKHIKSGILLMLIAGLILVMKYILS